ncbi:MAG: hypothetical protein RI995_1524 [Bacteroidota bacterium]
MIENQSILIVICLFILIYTGISIRYYLISKGKLLISKFLFVKFFIRSLLLFLLVLNLKIAIQSTENQLPFHSVYIVIDEALVNESSDVFIKAVNNQFQKYYFINKIGCILKTKNKQYYMLIPLIAHDDFIRYIDRFKLKFLPKIPVQKLPNNTVLLIEDLKNHQNNKEFELSSLMNNFNFYNFSKLRNYLLILCVFLFSVDLIIGKKIIKI